MEEQRTLSLAWWELHKAVPAIVSRLTGKTFSGMGVDVADANDIVPRRRMRFSDMRLSHFATVLPGVVIVAIMLGGGAALFGWLTGGLIGLYGGLVAGVVAGLSGGLARVLGVPGGIETSVWRSIRQDRAVALAAGLLGGLFGGTLGFVATHLAGSVVVGALGGAVLGMIAGFSNAAWTRYELTRIWLAIRGRLPFRLVGFLEDARAMLETCG